MALNGIDISHYQTGIDLSKVPGDFVIQKATEGTSYVDPTFSAHCKSAKAAGKLIGVYHFAKGGDAISEADWFVKSVKGYIGQVVLVLDWEATAVTKGSTWVETFVKRVIATTGVKPWIYGSLSPLQQHGIPALAKRLGCGLWVAKYGANAKQGYSHPAAPIPCTCFQFTSNGSLYGYSGRLDLNVYYGDRSSWSKWANLSSTKTQTPPTPKPTVKKYNLTRTLKRTYKISRLKRVWTTTGEDVKTLQRAVGFTGKAVDGIFGNDTYAGVVAKQKAFGFVGKAVDGIVGEDTAHKLGWTYKGK